MLSTSNKNLPRKVKKKNGRTHPFQVHKLHSSLKKTFRHLDTPELFQEEVIDEILMNISKSKKEVIDVEEIRKHVVKVLKKNGLTEAADHYELVFLHMPDMKFGKVEKRDGRIVKFNPENIFHSVRKAFSQAGKEDGKKCEKMTRDVCELISKKHGTKTIPVEQIKEAIEHVLIKNKHPDVAKMYSLYRYM